jgi:hypothetical protein
LKIGEKFTAMKIERPGKFIPRIAFDIPGALPIVSIEMPITEDGSVQRMSDPGELVSRINKLEGESARRALLFLLGYQLAVRDTISLEDAIDFVEGKDLQ